MNIHYKKEKKFILFTKILFIVFMFLIVFHGIHSTTIFKRPEIKHVSTAIVIRKTLNTSDSAYIEFLKNSNQEQAYYDSMFYKYMDYETYLKMIHELSTYQIQAYDNNKKMYIQDYHELEKDHTIYSRVKVKIGSHETFVEFASKEENNKVIDLNIIKDENMKTLIN